MNKTENKLDKTVEKAIFYAMANYLFSQGSIDASTLNKIKKKIETSS